MTHDRIELAHERVESRPEIMFGKPVIKGTRIPVQQILERLGQGMTPAEICDQHPRLTVEDVLAAVRFAAAYLAREEITLAGGQRV